MLEYSQISDLDEIDKAILGLLQNDGRLSNAELARRISLSPPATHSRLKRLEELGVIRQYAALVDRERLGYDMLCFVNVRMQMHQFEAIAHFKRVIGNMPEVLECHHITGEYDYLLKVVVRGRKDLERFIVNKLTPIPGVARVYTSLALAEVKSTTALPLE